MSDLDRFELFVQVAETKSLTQTADNLQLTKAAVSKQIKKLESDLRVDLFSRKGQRLSLTPQGEALLQQCFRLKLELENTRALCEDFHAAPRGKLYIVALDFFAQKIIYPRLAKFIKKYPNLEICIDTSERIPDFENEEVDIAVGFYLHAPGEVVRRQMANTRYVMCAAPEYFKKHGKPRKLKDLLQHQYIGHKERDEVQSDHLKPGYELKLKPTLVFNNVIGMIECAKQGLGIVQLPLYLVDKALKSGELIEVLTDYQAINTPVYYFYSKYRYTQPKIRCFIDFFFN